jgi:hypothetical protein
MGKVCRTCKEEKSTLKFHVRTAAPDGLRNDCKKCESIAYRKSYTTNRLYYLRRRYTAMLQRAEGRSRYPTGSNGLPICTREEFLNWCEETKDDFEKLWKVYEEADYSFPLAPSVDRIDNDRGYELENIRWITVHDNSVKQDKLATDLEDDRGSSEEVAQGDDTIALSAVPA